MNTTYFGSLIVTAAVLASSSSIRADLLQASDAHYGADSITIDTASGLAWLDLPFSSGLSYEQALLATAPGGEFAGFRPATAAEVLSLYSDAGIAGTGWVPETSPSLQPILSLIHLVGSTSWQDGNPETLGISGTLGEGVRVVPGLDFAYRDEVPGYWVTGIPGQTLGYGDSTAFPTVGVWLVSSIPEPQPWLIGSLGGVLLWAYSRLPLRLKKSAASSASGPSA